MEAFFSCRRTMLRILAAGLAAVGGAAQISQAAEVAHWSFDASENGIYPDSVKNQHAASPYDKAQVKPYTGKAPFGGAVMFTGRSGSFLTIPPLTDIQSSSFTVAVWVNLSSPIANYVLADWSTPQTGGFDFGFTPPSGRNQTKVFPVVDLLSDEMETRGRTTARTPLVRGISSSKDVPLNEWHHVAWVWDRASNAEATMKVYLDGEVVASGKQSHSPVDIVVNTRMMRIGSKEDPRNQNFSFNGSMDELWVFNTALSAEQLDSLIKKNSIDGVKAPEIASAPVPTPPKAAGPTEIAAAPAAVNAAVPVVSSQVPPAATGTPGPVIAASAPEVSAPVPVQAGPSTRPRRPQPPRNTSPVASVPPVEEAPAVVVPVTPPAAMPKLIPEAPPAVLSSTPSSGSPLKTVGVLACLVWAISMSTFLGWAMKERMRLRAAGKL